MSATLKWHRSEETGELRAMLGPHKIGEIGHDKRHDRMFSAAAYAPTFRFRFCDSAEQAMEWIEAEWREFVALVRATPEPTAATPQQELPPDTWPELPGNGGW